MPTEPMRVRDLIEALQQFDKDDKVGIDTGDEVYPVISVQRSNGPWHCLLEVDGMLPEGKE